MIVGLDLSLTCTGIATILPGGWVQTAAITSRGKRDDTLAQRAQRIRDLADRIFDYTPPGHVEVIIESPSHGQPGGSIWDRAGLWWLIANRLIECHVPVHHAAPTTVKKWIAGKGNADKGAVAAAVQKLFPDLTIGTSDEADALALAHIAAVRAGYSVPTRAGHNPDGWAAVKWSET